ncbi:MAG: recombinase family protein [Chloroflexi bacterium]|nr:recombinase family protein [Chloroflexota bacterium]
MAIGQDRKADKLTRCCVYARVSTEEQAEKDLSIPFHLERCRYYAQGKGWEVVKEFVDAGESARTDKRPDFQKMIAAARNKEFDVILAHKFDRFARNDYDFIVYEKELEDLSIIVESVSEPGDASTPAGYIGRRMMQVISTWYSKNLAIEVKKGMQKKMKTVVGPNRYPLVTLTNTIRTQPGWKLTRKKVNSLPRSSGRWLLGSGHWRSGQTILQSGLQG